MFSIVGGPLHEHPKSLYRQPSFVSSRPETLQKRLNMTVTTLRPPTIFPALIRSSSSLAHRIKINRPEYRTSIDVPFC